MRFISGDIVFPVNRKPVTNGILVIDSGGKILDLLDPLTDDISTSIPVEFFPGAICPGFVNTHCHLELSHLKGKFSPGNGLPHFIGEMIEKRNADPEEIAGAIINADQEMYNQGIVATGDISNTTATIKQKSKSKIHYHTFIEIFDIVPERATDVFNNGVKMADEFSGAGLNSSISPHAPYTVSVQLMKLIAGHVSDLITIHNQETLSENEMFQDGKGILLEKLRQISKSFNRWEEPGMTSLSSWIDLFKTGISLQLVHNTYTGVDDVIRANQKLKKLYWCLCVNANLFIENILPPVQLLSDQGCKITIGTDSYASNTSLSILNELKTIGKNFPDLSLETMLKWATHNGAEFLNVDDKYGSFEKGKTPGINHISNLDIKSPKLSYESKIHRIC